MKGNMIAFVVWILLGDGFVIGGITALFARKARPFGFWANAEVFPVKDVRAYNKALGKLFIAFGVIYAAWNSFFGRTEFRGYDIHYFGHYVSGYFYNGYLCDAD